MRGLLRYIFYVALLCTQVLHADNLAQKRVLFIASYHPAYPTFLKQQRGLHDIFDDLDIYFDTEYMDSKRFGGKVYEKLFLQTLSKKLDVLPPYDLVLAGDDNALRFVRKYRETLFPDQPVVFFGLNDVDQVSQLSREKGITGIAEDISLGDTLELIRELHPRVSEVIAITDPTASGQLDWERLKSAATQIEGIRVTKYDLSLMTFAELYARLELLDDSQAVLLLSGYRDRTGHVLEFQQLLSMLQKHLSRPLYQLWCHGIGEGVVGGKVVSHYEQAKQAALITVEILNGTSADDLPIEMYSPSRYVFDSIELSRFGVDRSHLPAGSILLNDIDFETKRQREKMRHALLVIVVLSVAAVLLGVSTYRHWFMLAQVSRHKAALDQAKDGVLICSKKGVVEYCNRAWAKMHGYEPEELRKVHASIFYDPEFYTQTVVPLRERVLKQGQGVAMLEHLRKDGSSFFSRVSISVVQEKAKFPKKVVSIIQDITEELKLQEQLSQRQKMESVGLLAGGLAHDFNNLLTPIMGYAELLGERHEDDPKSVRHACHILTAAERAKGLVLQLLAFSRKQAFAIEAVDMLAVVKEMEPILASLMPEGIELQEKLADVPCFITGDRHHLERVIMNLVVNACDATPGKGDILISVAPVTFDEEQVFYHVTLEPGDYVCLSVSDQGCGIDKQALDHLFEPFFTTKSVGHGSGLGLAVVEGIVKQHGGAIDVVSKPGEGAEFRLYFKRKKRVDETRNLEMIRQSKREKLLVVVEDNASVLDVIVSCLQEEGYTVKGFVGPESALEWVRHSVKPVTMLLTDVITSTLDGPELFNQMSEIFPDLKALFISHYSASVLDGMLSVDSYFDILSKPVDPDQLLAKVRAILEEG